MTQPKYTLLDHSQYTALSYCFKMLCQYMSRKVYTEFHPYKTLSYLLLLNCMSYYSACLFVYVACHFIKMILP